MQANPGESDCEVSDLIQIIRSLAEKNAAPHAGTSDNVSHLCFFCAFCTTLAFMSLSGNAATMAMSKNAFEQMRGVDYEGLISNALEMMQNSKRNDDNSTELSPEQFTLKLANILKEAAIALKARRTISTAAMPCTWAAQMDQILSQIHEQWEGFNTSATQVAGGHDSSRPDDSSGEEIAQPMGKLNIAADEGKQTEEMKAEQADWEVDKKRIASTLSFGPIIRLNVGGHTFATTLSTLTRYPESRLGSMFSGRHELVKDEAGAHFIDRDGRHFHEILNFLRSPGSFDNSEFQGRKLTELISEAEYYGLQDVMFPISKFAPETVNACPPGNQVTLVHDNN